MRKSILALVTIVALLAYLGLGPRYPRVGWVCCLLLPLRPDRSYNRTVRPVRRRDLERRKSEPRRPRRSCQPLGHRSFRVDRGVGRYLPAYTDRKGFWTLDGDAIRWLGVVLFAAGGALRIWPVFVLGHRFSGLVAIQPGHKLVTSGVYGVIRHPSYLGLLVNSLGWALAFRSGVGVLLTVLLIPPLLARIRAEERMLRTEFGGEYDLYCTRTSRLIPTLY
jgi:protein-S-isoprenylcysteine O-methyltransferase Ste14